MIVPSSMKGGKPSNSTIGGGGQQLGGTGSNGNMGMPSVSSILQNLRTPQGNNPNNMLQPI